MTDYGVVYASCRERITELVLGLPPQALSTVVPACPEWTVHDVLAHLAGETADLNRGKLEGVGSDEWTAAQVEARQDASLAELIEEWNAESTRSRTRCAPSAGCWPRPRSATSGTTSKTCGAPCAAGGHDPEVELIALNGYVQLKASSFATAGLPPLRLVAGDHTVQTADGEPAATVTAEPFELARAVCARRTADQLREYRWEGDPTPFIAALAHGGPTAPLPF